MAENVIPRRNYSSLADVKLPRSKRASNGDTLCSSEGESTNNELYRQKIVDENMENSQVKVRYVGCSENCDEWRARVDQDTCQCVVLPKKLAHHTREYIDRKNNNAIFVYT